ncbi:MAG: hypothetical protein AAGB14_15765 [Verrucomicrobiota bacterium]
MNSEEFQFRELEAAEPFLQAPAWPWWVWGIAGLIVIALILGIIAIARHKSPATPPDLGIRAEKAYLEAREEIDRAGSLQAAQQAATACSAAVRRYLSTVCGDPSLFETHEEFLARHHALESYPAEVRDRVSSNFCRLAEVKYGKSSTGDVASIVGDGGGLLDQLHQRRPA